MDWKYLQDYDREFEDKLHDSSMIFVRSNIGWLIAFSGDEPINWYDLPEVLPEEIFSGN